MTCALKYRNLRLGQVKSDLTFQFLNSALKPGLKDLPAPSPSFPVCQQEAND
jgi:hypothetical protein